ncbi:Nucleolar protein 16 [Serendipita sp. 411]|nr:Nucleolar protein 16 [Serendipita sp. 397]KAG8850189.1 Nucleolar protein 16 [Serendipita sp. 411]
MANPRQRRKQRSNHKAVRHSNHAKKRLRKMPPLKAPKALQDAWDSQLTVKQNYARLGLLSTLNPRAKGGSEFKVPSTSTVQDVQEAQNVAEGRAQLSVGRGRIIRDENGNIVDIEMEETEETEAGRDDEDEEVLEIPPEAEKWVAQTHAQKSEKSDLIRELETLSQRVSRVPRTASGGERAWLKQVVATYGDDLEAVARDRKLNPWQRTAGEIRRSIAKAGGMQRLR